MAIYTICKIQINDSDNFLKKLLNRKFVIWILLLTTINQLVYFIIFNPKICFRNKSLEISL